MKNYISKKKVDYNESREVNEPGNGFSSCLFCYKPLDYADNDFHKACVRKFFGQQYTPQLEYNFDDLKGLAQKVVQSQMAVTGVQAKLSLSLQKKEENNPVKKLTIVGLYGDYIMKPPSSYYPELPEVEDLTMHLADVCGIKAVPHSLIKLKDGTKCYITKRIDRTKKSKLHMEDMCQLTERLTEDKYKGSHEAVAKTILKYSANPFFDLTSFFEQVLLSYFTGNADMHLKNFSLLQNEQGHYNLAPAYDLLNTAIVNPADDEELALTLNGKKKKLKYVDFLTAFETLGMQQKQLDTMLYNFYYCFDEMSKWINNSFLSQEMKLKYMEVMKKRFEMIPTTIR